WRFRRGRRLEILNVPPPVAFRPLAAATARALRVAERQPHLEREIGAQEVGKISAVGANDHAHRVFAQTQVVEQDIAPPVGQQLMQRLPGERGIERRVEELLDPGGIQVFGLATPCVAQRPEASLGWLQPRRLGTAHGDVARDRAAFGWRALARELRVPGAGGRWGGLGGPEIGRTAGAVPRFGRDVSIGRDQRKLALERLLRDDEDAQRHALPGRERRGQDRELGRVFTEAEWTFGPRVHPWENDDEKRACDQQHGCHSGSSKLAYLKQLSPLPLEGLPWPQFNSIAKALAESWQNSSPGEFDGGTPRPSAF